jgi:hypothetical protein
LEGREVAALCPKRQNYQQNGGSLISCALSIYVYVSDIYVAGHEYNAQEVSVAATLANTSS